MQVGKFQSFSDCQSSVPFGGCISWGCWVPVTPLGLWWVDRLPRVGDLGDEPVDVVGRVAGCLDSTIGQRDRERASYNTLGVLGLRLLEVGLAVVVGHAVLVGVRLGGQFLLYIRGCRGGIRRCRWLIRWGRGGIGWFRRDVGWGRGGIRWFRRNIGGRWVGWTTQTGCNQERGSEENLSC